MPPATLLQFRDRRSAYRFVSEIRRRYDLDRLATVRVQPAEDVVVVEMPSEGYSAEVADVAERHGGFEPATAAELERLRAVMAAARQTERDTRSRLQRARQAFESAGEAMIRRRARAEADDEGGEGYKT